ncbi:acyltransferase family protein [soil metagenome]
MAVSQSPRGLDDAQISRAVSVARIVLIIGLVFLHYDRFPNARMSPFDGFDDDFHPLATWVSSTVLFMLFSAVPLLSMVSGWFFFSFDHISIAALARKIIARMRTLYVTLVFWNALVLISLFGLYHAFPQLPIFGLTNISFANARWLDYFNAVFGATKHPVAFQFWFVRDLCVTVLVSPLLWLALKRAPWVGVLVLGTAWLAGSHLGVFFRTDVPFFFYLGAMVRMRPTLRLDLPWNTTLLLAFVYVALAGLRALAPEFVDFADGAPRWLDVATRAMRIVGVLACWGLVCRLAATGLGARIAPYGGLSYFLFATHWPLIEFVKAGSWQLMPAETDAWMLVHYVASALITVSISLGLGAALAQVFPGVFAWMNGGRELGQARSVRPQPMAAAAPP